MHANSAHHIARRLVSVVAAALACALTLASGQAAAAGDIAVSQAFARPTVPGQPTGGAYISLENRGKVADTLKSVSSAVAKSTEVHTMKMDGDVMRMREVGSIDIKPSEKISMQPGDGYHIMLMGLNKPLKSGEHFPMTLDFAKAGKINVDVTVEAPGDKTAGHMH